MILAPRRRKTLASLLLVLVLTHLPISTRREEGLSFLPRSKYGDLFSFTSALCDLTLKNHLAVSWRSIYKNSTCWNSSWNISGISVSKRFLSRKVTGFVMDDNARRTAARERWKILGNALRGKSSNVTASAVSVRRFACFELFAKEPIAPPNESLGTADEHLWQSYRWSLGESSPLRIRYH